MVSIQESRFALLKIDDDVDEDKASKNKTTSNESQNSKNKKKKKKIDETQSVRHKAIFCTKVPYAQIIWTFFH